MFRKLRDYRILPLVEVDKQDDALHVAEALTAGGLPTMELMYRRHVDHTIIREVRRQFPDFWIGAGGVLNRDLLLRVIDVNACFALSPGVNPETIQTALQQEFLFAPGVCTPSDIETALICGSANFQFYPAELSGGAAMLKELIESFGHLPIEFLPKGGITEKNCHQYLAIPQVAAVSVSWLVDEATVANGNWSVVTKRAKKVLDLSASVRPTV